MSSYSDQDRGTPQPIYIETSDSAKPAPPAPPQAAQVDKRADEVRVQQGASPQSDGDGNDGLKIKPETNARKGTDSSHDEKFQT